MSIEKDQIISELHAQVALLVGRVKSLERENADLEARLLKYETPKNSGNSSIAPSQDPNRKTKSRRGKSNRAAGGQKGHQGSSLEMRYEPDYIEFHQVCGCQSCGQDLEDSPVIGSVRGQVYEIPPMNIRVTEHRALHHRCKGCGALNKVSLPSGVLPGATYGARFKGLCCYLQNYHMIPFDRCSELLNDLTGHCPSKGSLANFQVSLSKKLESFLQKVRERLLQSPVLHADETGIRAEGKGWFHVLSNESASLFLFHQKRGREAMDQMGVTNLYKGTLVHDRFASYFSYNCDHSLCNAHILRNLQYVEESCHAPWAKKMARLLIKAKRKKDAEGVPKKAYRTRIYNQYISLIDPVIKAYDQKFKKTEEQKLAFAMKKHVKLFLKFLEQPEVPFDNNQAERDLRMIKVKQKVSGCFRSTEHAQCFARTRSYISTLKKNKQNILDSLQNAFEGNPFMP